jgi:hypothetical protein
LVTGELDKVKTEFESTEMADYQSNFNGLGLLFYYYLQMFFIRKKNKLG